MLFVLLTGSNRRYDCRLSEGALVREACVLYEKDGPGYYSFEIALVCFL